MIVQVKKTGKMVEVVPMYNNHLMLKDVKTSEEYGWDEVITKMATPALGQSLTQESQFKLKVNMNISASVETVKEVK